MRRINFPKVACIVLFAGLVLSLPCFAQETITITTYYPSPDGSYNNLDTNFLQADRIAVGNGNNPAALADGVINMINLGAAPAGPTVGSIYFGFNPQSLTNSVLNYYDGANWFPMQPAMLVAYGAGTLQCLVAGTHVVGVLADVNIPGVGIRRIGASMEPCDTAHGADPYLVGTSGGMARPADAQGDFYITGASCAPQSGWIICN
ncbi:MAG: hypothetical protein WC486_06155 [Candidatus Omnitrophota bacterium]|jgi:hypothetical protein